MAVCPKSAYMCKCTDKMLHFVEKNYPVDMLVVFLKNVSKTSSQINTYLELPCRRSQEWFDVCFLGGQVFCFEAVGSQCLELGVFHLPANTSLVTSSSLTNTRAQVSLHTL